MCMCMQPLQSSAVCCTARVAVIVYVDWQMTFCFEFMIAEDATAPEEDEHNVAKNKGVHVMANLLLGTRLSLICVCSFSMSP